MPAVVFLATAWGLEHGGINSFNLDLCTSLAALRGGHRICCLVLRAAPAAVQAAWRNDGVVLLSLDQDGEDFPPEDGAGILEVVRGAGLNDVTWWIGHDLKTGPAALAAKRAANSGNSAIILHTDYLSFKHLEGGDVGAGITKEREQETLLRNADLVFAVGPKLLTVARDRIGGMRRTPIIELVPGLAKIAHLPAPSQFRAITMGRLDKRSERVKQGRLALASFAALLKRLPNAVQPDPVFTLLGVNAAEAEELKQFANEKADRLLAVYPLPYSSDRAVVFEQLAKQSVALMLSVHEGFGLAGWEAISAGVPLILSRNSGVYALIDRTLGGQGTGCLYSIDVMGSADPNEPHPADLAAISNALLTVAQDPARARQNAAALKRQLKRFTWESAARNFAVALNRFARGKGDQSQPKRTNSGDLSESSLIQRDAYRTSRKGKRTVPLRVLVVCARYPPDRGGGGPHTWYLASELAKLGCSVRVLTSSSESRSKPYADFGKDLLVHRVPFRRGEGFDHFTAVRSGLKICQEFGPDVIHGQHLQGIHIALRLKATFGVPLVGSVHKTPDLDSSPAGLNGDPNFSEIRLLGQLGLVDAFVAGSRALKKAFLSAAGRQDTGKVKVIEFGVPHQWLRYRAYSATTPSDVGLQLMPDEKLIVCLGRLDRGESLEPIVVVAAELLRRLPNLRVKFLVTVEPRNSEEQELHRALIRLAIRHGVEDRLVFKSVDFYTLPVVLRFSQVCVLLRANGRESVLEAMALRIPVVAPNSGDIREVIREDGTGCLLFESGDTDALTGQLIRLLTDVEPAKELTRKGLALIRGNLNAEKMAERHLRLYRRLQG